MSNKDTKHIKPRLRFPEFLKSEIWVENTIGNISPNITAGATPSTTEPKYWGGDVRWMNSGELNLKKVYEVQGRITQLGLNNSSTKILPKRCVLVGLAGQGKTRGTVAMNFVELCTNQSIAAIHPNESIFISDFLYHNLDNRYDELRRISAGDGGRGGLNLQIIKNLKIHLPKDKKEQQKIADCLSSIDELITAESKKLDALRIYKKGLMQQLFPAKGETLPKLRFPEFNDSGNWKKIRIIDLASKEVKWSFTGGPFGSNLKSSDYTNTGIRVIQLQNIGDGEFVDNYKIYTSENKANELLSCNIYPGEIILSKMGDPVARACLIPDKEKRYVMCSDGIRLAVDKNKFDSYFIYSFINSEIFRAIAEKSSTGSTRKRIGLDILKNLTIMIPTIKEQQKIAEMLYLLDDFITNQSKKMDALKNHKKGLMQQLFPIMSEL